MTDRNSGNKSDHRNANGTFAPGNPGKPKGSRHRATQAVQALFDGQATEITQKAVAMALEGDSTALRLCVERIAPARKDSPVEFEMPEVKTSQDAADLARSILRAVSTGDVTPLEGASLMALVEQFRRTLETSELETRIAALEAIK